MGTLKRMCISAPSQSEPRGFKPHMAAVFYTGNNELNNRMRHRQNSLLNMGASERSPGNGGWFAQPQINRHFSDVVDGHWHAIHNCGLVTGGLSISH